MTLQRKHRWTHNALAEPGAFGPSLPCICSKLDDITEANSRDYELENPYGNTTVLTGSDDMSPPDVIDVPRWARNDPQMRAVTSSEPY